MTVRISQSMRDSAAAAEAKVMARMKSGGNYTKLEAEHRFYYGFLGEFAFAELLRLNDVRHDFNPTYEGRDITDIVVYVNDGQGVPIDVKTATNARHKFLMIPTAQLRSHPSDVYVGVQLTRTTARIWGSCMQKALRPIEREMFLSIPTHGLELKRLTPIEQVIAKCDKASLQTTMFDLT